MRFSWNIWKYFLIIIRYMITIFNLINLSRILAYFKLAGFKCLTKNFYCENFQSLFHFLNFHYSLIFLWKYTCCNKYSFKTGINICCYLNNIFTKWIYHQYNCAICDKIQKYLIIANKIIKLQPSMSLVLLPSNNK